MEKMGFRINKNSIDRVGDELIELFRMVPVANIGDVINRQFCLSYRMKRMNKELFSFCGSAITVFVRNGDNLLLYKAIEMAKEGDVIVVNAKGCLDNAIMGELILRWAESKGIAGFIINGAIRDYNYITKSKVAVYAVGVTPAGPYKDGIGEINYPISIDGVVINPGDLIVGDSDGIVVVNRENVERVYKDSIEIDRKEKEIIEEINGNNYCTEWVEKRLKELGM